MEVLHGVGASPDRRVAWTNASRKAFAGLVPNERKRFGALGRQTRCDAPGQARTVATP